jgi:hypothetical protein
MTKLIRKEILVWAGIVLAVLCVLTALLYFGMVKPRAYRLEAARSKLAAKRAELDSLSDDRVRRIMKQAETSRTELGEYVLMAGQQGELSVQLSQSAAGSRVTDFTSREMAGGTTSTANLDNVGEQRMRMTFAGDYRAFADFVYALECNRPAVFIDGFNVTHDSRDETRVTADMESTVLYELKGKKQM